MKKTLRVVCLFIALIVLFGSIEGTQTKVHLEKHKYKILYNKVNYDLDAIVVVILDQTNKHYCVYLIDPIDSLEKLRIEEIFSLGRPVSFETAKEYVDLEKLGINLYGF